MNRKHRNEKWFLKLTGKSLLTLFLIFVLIIYTLIYELEGIMAELSIVLAVVVVCFIYWFGKEVVELKSLLSDRITA